MSERSTVLSPASARGIVALSFAPIAIITFLVLLAAVTPVLGVPLGPDIAAAIGALLLARPATCRAAVLRDGSLRIRNAYSTRTVNAARVVGIDERRLVVGRDLPRVGVLKVAGDNGLSLVPVHASASFSPDKALANLGRVLSQSRSQGSNLRPGTSRSEEPRREPK